MFPGSTQISRAAPSGRVGCLAATFAHGIGSVVASRTRPPCQHSGATGCPPRPAIFQPPTPVSPHLHRQRVGPVHLGGVPHEVAGPLAGVDRTPLCAAVEGPDFPGAPRTYGSQRRCQRSQPSGATQHGMDAASVSVRGNPPLGGPAGSGPDGVADQPPPPSLGVRFSPPGRRSGGLSQYRLGRLQVLVSLPSFGHASAAAPPDPRVSCSAGGGGTLETPRAVVSSSASESRLTPSPAHDPVPADRFGDCGGRCAGWSMRCWPHIALLLGDSMTSRGVIFRPGCPLTCPKSPMSRCWNFFSTCLTRSASVPARSFVTGQHLSGCYKRPFRSILGTVILVARPQAFFTSAICASPSVGPQ